MQESSFSPVRSPRLSEQIIRQIRQLIDEGQIQLDARFPSERSLQERWNVSRPVLREAFRVLEMQGVVESRAGGGRFLRSKDIPEPVLARRVRLAATSAHLLQLWDVREAVEAKAAELAALNATDADLAELQRVVDLRHLAPPQVLRDSNFNRKFHSAVARATHNVVIESVMDDLLRRSDEAGFRALIDIEDWTRLQPAHEAIHEAIAARDPARAREAVAHHFAGLRGCLRPAAVPAA
jgi:GntR family transcriptional repressor for pyruvate dehydrogenase complex